MKTIIVGGTLGRDKDSSICQKLFNYFPSEKKYYNINNNHSICGDLVLWMPDIPNSQKKEIPKKQKGSVMIISKVIHDDRTEVDAVSRIFTFHANAVICIYKDDPLNVRFRLIDALGNTWTETTDIQELALIIMKFYGWSNGQVRESYTQSCDHHSIHPLLDQEFINLNTYVANQVESSLGSRYFGNFSTRCMKLFPSQKVANDMYLFSPRNTDKKRLEIDDCVLIIPPYYYSSRKYSVDSPVQVEIYRKFYYLNYMIHGHAFIEGAPTTENYYPCGDLREVYEIIKMIEGCYRRINLKNHGFLLAAIDLNDLERMINSSKFHVPNMLR